MPHLSREKHILAINKLEQCYDYKIYQKKPVLFGVNKSCYYLTLVKDKFALNLPCGSEEEDF